MTDTAEDRTISFDAAEPAATSTARQREAEANLAREARRRAALAGVPVEMVERELLAQQRGANWAVETEDRTGAAFFRCEQRGNQRVLILNAAHPFYLELYAAPWTTARQRAALEILLWTLGEAEVDAEPDSELWRWYVRERATIWSPDLAGALTALGRGWA